MSWNLIGLVRPNRDLEMLLSFHSDTKDGHALNSLLGLFHTTSSKPYITLSRNLMEGFRQHGDWELAEIITFQRLPSTKQPSWYSSTNIFQTIYPLEQKLMKGFLQHGDSEVAKIIPFAYQRLPDTKQQSWNSSNIIIFQTIYPLEQKLNGRQQADRFYRKAEIIPLRCQRGSSIEQPSWYSSNIIFQTICPLEQKLDEICQAK